LAHPFDPGNPKKGRYAQMIAPHLVMIARDDMALVFDYDPLIRQIDTLARASHFETQERLMTQIVEACAGYLQIEAVDIVCASGLSCPGPARLACV
jgi:GTP cyclohydrolase I